MLILRQATRSFLAFLVLSLIAQIVTLKIHALASSESVCSDYAARSTCGGADKIAGAQEQINRYLETEEGAKGDFYIQGWRWHTLSLAREARRLQKVAEKLYSASVSQSEPLLDLESIKSAADYIVGFNMKGLHKIEKDLFFPWARKKVEDLNQPAIGQAFGALMDHLEGERRLIADLGNDLAQVTAVAANPSIDVAARSDAFKTMATKSAAIADCARSMLDLEDQLLVPTLARVVPASEQKSFNDKVIRNLGIFDSRLHLVGMYEAVWELNDENERALFQKSIPSLPRMMIPRWKRLLYEPRVGVLNQRSL